jgi:hypothetical protein
MSACVVVRHVTTMPTFTVTAGAWELIRKALSRTQLPEPVIYLIEVSDEIKVPPDVAAAITGGADESTIRALAQRSGSIADALKGPRRLMPAVYPRSQFPGRHLITKDGVVFAAPPPLAKKLDGGTVDLGERGLVLRDAAGVVVMPQ